MPVAPGAETAEDATERVGPLEDDLALRAQPPVGEAAAPPEVAWQAPVDPIPATRTEGAEGSMASHHIGPATSPMREDVVPTLPSESVPATAGQGAPQHLTPPSAAAVPANVPPQQAAPTGLLSADGAPARSPTEPVSDHAERGMAGERRGERIASTAEPVGAIAVPSAAEDAAIAAPARAAQATLLAEALSPIEPSPDPERPAPTENGVRPETPEAVPARTPSGSEGDEPGLVDTQLVAARSDPPPSVVTAERPAELVAPSGATDTVPGEAPGPPERPLRDRQDARASVVRPALLADANLKLSRADPEPAPAVGEGATPRAAPASAVDIAPVPADASETGRIGVSDEIDAVSDQEATTVPSGATPAALSRTRDEPAAVASAGLSSEALAASTASTTSAPQPPAVAGSPAVQREMAPEAYPNANSADRSESPASPSAVLAAAMLTAGDRVAAPDALRGQVPADAPAADTPADRLDAGESGAGAPGGAAAEPDATQRAAPEDVTGRAWPEDADRPSEERSYRGPSPEPTRRAVVGVSEQSMRPESAAPSAAVSGGPVSGNAVPAPSGTVPVADGNRPVGERAGAERPAAPARSLDISVPHAQTIGASQPAVAAFAGPEDGARDDSGTAGNEVVELAPGDGAPMATMTTPPRPDAPVERPPTGEEVGPAASAPPVVAPDAADSQIAAAGDEVPSAHTPSLAGSIEPAGDGAGGTARAPVASPPAIVQRAVAEASADAGPVAPAASAIAPRHAPAVEREANDLAPDPAADRALATVDPASMPPVAGGEPVPELGPRAEQVAEIVQLRPRPAGVPRPVRPQAARDWAADSTDAATAERLERLASLLVPDMAEPSSSPAKGRVSPVAPDAGGRGGRPEPGTSAAGPAVPPGGASGVWGQPGVVGRVRPEPAPIGDSARRLLAPLVGVDPASVRVYRGPEAGAAAAAQAADAFTVGDTVVLGAGAPAETPETMGLLAHELTHVARNRQPRFIPPIAGTAPAFPTTPNRPSDGAGPVASEEGLARQVEERVRGAAQRRVEPSTGPTGYADRDPAPETASRGERSSWGRLPAPWEPLPDWLAPPPDSATSGALGDDQWADASAPDGIGFTSQAIAVPGPGIQRAETGRQPVAVAPQAASVTAGGGQPEPDLDALARQVYSVLRRRLEAERRRTG